SQVLIARRDTREKIAVAMDGLTARLHELLADVQRTMLERAVKFRDDHTQRVASYEEFKQVMEGRPGFVIAGWCGSADCEARIKAEPRATIRTLPLGTAAAPDGRCVRCDAASIAEAWFAKSY